MPCFHPLDAFKSLTRKANGKYAISFTASTFCCVPIRLPCGQCTGCRLARSGQWAVRCVHEAQFHAQNCLSL